MAAFEDEMARRRKAYKDEMYRRQSQATRNRLVAAGLWSPPLAEAPQQSDPAQPAAQPELTPIQRLAAANEQRLRQVQGGNATQNAQDAPRRPEAPRAAPEAQQVNFLPDARQRAQDGRDRQQARIASQIAHVEGAFRDENDSRVAQAREAKRMEFSRDIERMRQEALLQRLAMEQSDNPRRFAPQSPLAVRSWNPATGEWEYREPDENGNIAFGG